MKQSPLFHKFKKWGARFQEIQGWELPSDFGSTETEWKAVRTHVGTLDLSHRGKILVKGNDRVAFLHSMLSNDIKNLSPGSCCYATILTPKGKIIADLNVFAFEDYHLLELDEVHVEKIIKHLSSFIISEDIEMKDVGSHYGILSLQGPDAEFFLKHLPQDNLNFRAFSNDRTGDGGYDLWVTVENLEKLWDQIQTLEKIQPIGLSALEVLRIEAGIPKFNQDLDENTIPNEARLDHAISWTKGCYPGQEIVARIKYRGGVQRILSGLMLKENISPQRGDKVFKDSNIIGIVTSAIYSFYLNCPIALAYLRNTVITGSEVQIHHQEKILIGKIQNIPFYPVRNELSQEKL
jgi:folate-binding protein YgfZ